MDEEPKPRDPDPSLDVPSDEPADTPPEVIMDDSLARLDELPVDVEEPWLDPTSEEALRAVIPHHMDATSAAMYARWWQLETWLRDLVYIELRALHGLEWQTKVRAGEGRRLVDARLSHMASPDNENPLAYLDYSQLVKIIDEQWELFERGLLERESWRGRQTELRQIRHRIGHMRRGHADDLARLEQTLRDLERGAFITYASYNDREWVDPETLAENAVVDGWILEHHDDARRLIAHAERQYETRIVVDASRRPWADPDVRLGAGTLWHASFHAREQPLDISGIWRDVARGGLADMIVLFEAENPRHVTFTFSAVDDPAGVADAIGAVFEMVLTHRSYREIHWGQLARWQARVRLLDYRVASGDGWTIVTPTTVPMSIFGAGGQVEQAPKW